MGNLYLVGFMGVGKTAVGRCLARHLGRDFVDLDEAVEAHLGRPITEIFAELGEAAFRSAESDELRQAASRSDLVVATGGGAFSSAENRRLIHSSGGVSVFLDVPWAVIRRRLGADDPDRPKWDGGDRSRRLWEHRSADYRAARVRIELAGDEPPEAVAGLVAEALVEVACAS